jgi:hypothetical protein
MCIKSGQMKLAQHNRTLHLVHKDSGVIFSGTVILVIMKSLSRVVEYSVSTTRYMPYQDSRGSDISQPCSLARRLCN